MSELKHSRKRRKTRYIIVDLDKIPELKSGILGLHADKLIITNTRMVVVEEAKTLKKRDLDQLANTIKELKRNRLSSVLANHGIQLPNTEPVGILHCQGGSVDSVVENLRAKYIRELKTAIYTVNCNKHLHILLEKLLSK
ncbi:MAG TPA: hypothetical protein EYH59_00945 [Pyrodictium sp.]|nr:hypothetical protein [Pyrodictium sp.]